jgi:hypothetical protein
MHEPHLLHPELVSYLLNECHKFRYFQVSDRKIKYPKIASLCRELW